VLRFAGFELDQERVELRGPDGAAVKLRPKTFQMLRLFAANPGRVLSKNELMETVWPNVHVGEDNLFQCIREIRAALQDDERQLIKLVSGRGYRFEAGVSVAPPGATAQADDALPAQTEPDPRPNAAVIAEPATSRRFSLGLRGPFVIAAVAGLSAIIGLAVAAPTFRPDFIFKRTPPIVAVMPIVDASNDRDGTAMAAGVTDRLTEGLARIDNIRVAAPRSGAASAAETASAPSQSDFVLHGELQKSPQSWTLRTRVVKSATGEVEAVATVSVDVSEGDVQLQQTRLAARAGDPLARRLNALLESGAPAGRSGNAKAAIEQATASIKQTTPERFATAQTMLESALAAEPDNTDLKVALAALQLRGVQMAWYDPAASAAAESSARVLLESASKAQPGYIPVLEAYCRFLTATNQFIDSLVACARALSFDPWNGSVLYHIGLAQIQLGRFEDALATFRQADRFDTPEVSRWTWLLGAGWASHLMGRDEDAVSWLQRSLAITPGTGRLYFGLAAVYQRLGRTEDAKAALARGMELRPGSTAINVSLPKRNASPVFLEASARTVQTMVEVGLPEH
jgi:DNA-binding winged helix-turn-helix (wHTH) protein/tetratricopeptide (TPR) repeat protein